MPYHSNRDDDRHGARQKKPFNLERASRLDDPSRFEYLPVSEVASLLDIPAQGRVVDFGAGTGTYAIELARLRPDVEVIAVDELPEMLERLRTKPAAAELPNLKSVLTSDIGPLERRIDRVLALNVLHELGDNALAGLAALLVPSGAAILIDWNAEVDRPHGPPGDHVYSPAEARARLEGLGFRVESQRVFLYHYAFRAQCPQR
jgi:SAM-dependent methyltransferase